MRGIAESQSAEARAAACRPKQQRHQRRRWLPLAKGKQGPRPAIGDEQVGSVLAARLSVPSVTLPTGCLWKNFIRALDFKRLRYVKVAS